MTPLPITVTDEELIQFIDRWVLLLEQEDYEAAFNFTDHDDNDGWNEASMRDAIKRYTETVDAADPNQSVTLKGSATDRPQVKEVDRFPEGNAHGYKGEIWYDLNINGKLSDLTATFTLHQTAQGIIVKLMDIHVH